MDLDRPSLLLVTDSGYQAQGRRYADEDLSLAAALRSEFAVACCHPADAVRVMDAFDLVLVRNSGPVAGYRREYDAFRAHARATGARVYNELTGRADMTGKRYLRELYVAGFPVIPTAETADQVAALPEAGQYVVKPVLGADSAGLRFVERGELSTVSIEGRLVQPRIDFAYEVSFYFVDDQLMYALYAPDPDRRWVLEPYRPTAADREVAQRFVDWNTIGHGIQRVDLCRAPDGRLLLVELEDLNPYLSLDLLDPGTRDRFVETLRASLHRLLRS
jgi:hypothetical protein